MRFTTSSRAIVHGTQLEMIQRMLDFDYLCGRGPSVAAIISSRPGNSYNLMYGNTEIAIPTISQRSDIEMLADPATIDTLLVFASARSASPIVIDAIQTDRFANIMVVAEWIPENETRQIIALAASHDVNLLWPSTVGGIVPWVFRIGNTGWSLDNIIASRLYQQWSVWLVSKSAGMMNDLSRFVAQQTNGIHTAMSIGGDRYPYSTFGDIVRQYDADPAIKLIVMLGEVGNEDENRIADLVASGEITTPIVAWVTGSAAEQLDVEIQFGHAGAKALSQAEDASSKIAYLRERGIHVPSSYDTMSELIGETFGAMCPDAEIYPAVPADILAKHQIIQTRRPSLYTSTITDERGDELRYNGVLISELAWQGVSPSLGRVIGHLWLRTELPSYAVRLIDTVLVLMADHGPAVSGTANVILTSRAGNTVVNSVTAGIQTIGPRFGGAITWAARYFFDAVQRGLTPQQFVDEMKAAGTLIPGIGHKVKSKFNPDKRSEILDGIAAEFGATPYLDFAKQVEQITLQKRANLILNVDGYIAMLMLQVLEDIGCDKKTIEMYIDADLFNGLFVAARTIGFIGHHIDQKRLCHGLYRTPWDMINYDVADPAEEGEE